MVVADPFSRVVPFVAVTTAVSTVMYCWPRFSVNRWVFWVSAWFVSIVFIQYNLQHYHYGDDDPQSALEIAYACSVLLLIVYALAPVAMYALTGMLFLSAVSSKLKGLGLHYVVSAEDSWYGIALGLGVPLVVGLLLIELMLYVIGQDKARAVFHALLVSDATLFGWRYLAANRFATAHNGLEDYHPDGFVWYVGLAVAVAARLLYGFGTEYCRRGEPAYIQLSTAA